MANQTKDIRDFDGGKYKQPINLSSPAITDLYEGLTVIPTEDGIYTKFNNLERKDELCNFIYESGAWVKKTIKDYTEFKDLNNKNKSFGFVKNVFSDEFLELPESITRVEELGGDGFARNTGRVTMLYNDDEKINGFERTVECVVTASGTAIQFQLLADTLLALKTKQINVSATLLFPIDISISAFLYKRGGSNEYLTDTIGIDFKANIEQTISLTAELTDSQKSEITQFAFYIQQGESNLNGKTFYISPVFVTDGENKQTNTNPKRVKKYLEEEKLLVSDEKYNYYPYNEFFNCVGYDYLPITSVEDRSFYGFVWESTFSYYTTELSKKFIGYDKSLAVNVVSSDFGTRVQWQLPNDYISEDLKIEKKLNFRFQLLFPEDVEISIGLYAYKASSPGFTDGGLRTLNISANTVYTVEEVFNLTDSDFINLDCFSLYIRHSGATGLAEMDNKTFYVSSINCWSGEKRFNLVENGNLNTTPPIECWGDSITAADEYQPGIASELEISSNLVSNNGVSSDWTQHIRNRFVNYYTANPDELKNRFFVIFIGTNNLLNYAGREAFYTTGSPAYIAAQPNYDFNYDTMWAASYRDQFLRDLNIMLDMIPNENYVIIPGHCGAKVLKTKNNWKAMDSLDSFLNKTYPHNTLLIRNALAQDYNYLDTYVTASFTKPTLGGTVTISLSKTSWINNTTNNPTGKIAIGTKEMCDIYDVVSINGLDVTCTLSESRLLIPEGDTVRFEYNLVSDLDRDEVVMQMQCFSYDDIISFENENIPQSLTDDYGIHPTKYYNRMGELIGKKIKKVLNRND